MGRPASLLRSLLFVPATAERYVAKAHLRGADGIILDLEDSIAGPLKQEARQRAGDAIDLLAGRGVRQIFVRINADIVTAVRDLDAVVRAGLAGLVVPKCESVEYVEIIASALATFEEERGLVAGSVVLGIRVETPKGFFRMQEIAVAHERIAFFGLGGEDFSFAIGMEPTVEVLRYPKQQAIIAARAAGVAPIGLIGSGSDFSDPEAIRHNALLSRQFGFEGATCIHPALVPILNEAFTPSAAEIDHARRLIEAYDIARSEGRGAIGFEGKMVDAPVAARARRVLSIGIAAAGPY